MTRFNLPLLLCHESFKNIFCTLYKAILLKFYIYVMQPPEMDYKCFLDFVLAFENRNSESSLLYMWRILDINKDGLLTPSTIRLFFRDISAILLNTGYDACPSAEDVVIEVRDMVGGAIDVSEGVTLRQIIKSGQGYTVIYV